MGRAVSYPPGSLIVAFTELDGVCDEDDFEFFLEFVQDKAQELWPSFEPAGHWLSREDHAIAENALGYVGVSAYDNVATVWFVPKENDWNYSDTHQREALARGFAKQIEPKFLDTFATLKRLGVMSNGANVYERLYAEG